MKTLKANLTINRPYSGDSQGKVITIELTDELSGCIAVKVEVAGEEFMNALFSMAIRPCTMLFNDSGVVGMKSEHKQEHVFVPDGDYKQRKTIAAKALNPHEVDGWKGDKDDCQNNHRRVKSEVRSGVKGYVMNVTFRRYVVAS